MSLTIGELVGHNVLSCFLGVVEKSEIQPIALVLRWNDENLLARFVWNSISYLSRSHETVRLETGGAGLEVFSLYLTAITQLVRNHHCILLITQSLNSLWPDDGK